MLAKIGIAAAVLLAVLLIAIATRPPTFTVRRSAIIAAPAKVVYAQIQDLHNWPNWMSYDRMDPAMRRSYSGPEQGVGATYHYVSDKVGEGRMTIARLEPNRRVAVQAQFIKPFAATNDVEFTLQPAEGGIRVTWAISGRNTFAGKAMSLFVNMDRMIGRDFESGLADLKRVSENEARTAAVPAGAGADS
ncbi:MAG TPA: SRPBCC family protein [Longimicrobium sp.]|nr:SRPBCC family protein [Longimicrobium sp.]